MVKIRRTLAALMALCLLLALTACAGEKKSKQFEISLEGNPTTGYAWTYTMDPEGIVKEVKNDYTSSTKDKDVVGAGGTFLFVFEGVSAGEVKLTFEYKRSWETEPAIQTAEYVLAVDAEGYVTCTSSPTPSPQ